PFMRRREFISFTGAVAAMLLAVLAPGEARAAWPERTATIIVPFPPGGPNDPLGPLLAARLAPPIGHSGRVRRPLAVRGITGAPTALAPRPTATPWWSSPLWC